MSILERMILELLAIRLFEGNSSGKPFVPWAHLEAEQRVIWRQAVHELLSEVTRDGL